MFSLLCHSRASPGRRTHSTVYSNSSIQAWKHVKISASQYAWAWNVGGVRPHASHPQSFSTDVTRLWCIQGQQHLLKVIFFPPKYVAVCTVCRPHSPIQWLLKTRWWSSMNWSRQLRPWFPDPEVTPWNSFRTHNSKVQRYLQSQRKEGNEDKLEPAKICGPRLHRLSRSKCVVHFSLCSETPHTGKEESPVL